MTFPHHRLLGAACLAALCASCWPCPSARAADEPSVLDRVNRELEDARADQTPASSADRLGFNWGGEAGLSYVHTDAPGRLSYSAMRADLKLYGFISDEDRQMVYVRVRGTHDDGFGRDLFLGSDDRPASTRDALYFDRFWYRVDLAKALGADASKWDARAQIGLQQVRWGSGLVLDDALYAGLVDVGGAVCPEGSLWLTGMAGYTPDRDFYEFDQSRPYYNTNVSRMFYGAQLAWQDNGPLHTKVYGYFLQQQDRNANSPATPLGVPPFLTPMPARFGYDSQYWGLGASGAVPGLAQLSYLAEGVMERGRSTSTPMNSLAFAVPQTREDIEAWAAQAQLAWTFRDTGATRLEAEVLAGSGDSDRFGSSTNTLGGNASGTKDAAFNAFGYAKTGLVYNAPVSNLLSMRLGASSFVIPKELKVGADAYLFRKLSSNGASQESTKAGSDLGAELDLHAEWKVLSDVTLSAHYGIFLPGADDSNGREVRHFIFTGVRYAF